jgi:hypothetical protein
VALVPGLPATGFAAGGLLPQLWGEGGRVSGWHRCALVAIGLLLGGALLAPPSPATASSAAAASAQARPSPKSAPAESGKPPVFAYYYIWYTRGSWDRAKTDMPELGPYSSADSTVIAQHIRWARQAGIDGFIVSWKHETRLDVPLERLVAEAAKQNFKLILLYQGLDFDRNPIDPKKVLDDLSWFARTYGTNPVFDVFGRAAVVWSGTWKFTDDQIGMVRAGLGAPDNLLLLGSERSAADYQKRAALFDGDAYYWSSGDPLATPGYQQRIDALSAVIRADRGAWIAPISPGFDARLVGGTSTVDRRDGATYRAAWRAAVATDPAALGIISWNEFSENSHIEPSLSYRTGYLDLTNELTGGPSGSIASPTGTAAATASPTSPVVGPTDSSELSADSRSQQLLSVVSGLALLAALGFVILRLRGRPTQMSH